MRYRDDKMMAAVHEAGHLTVLCAMGVRARAYIQFHVPSAIDESSWLGWCQYPKMRPPLPSVGVAGVVAECLHHSEAMTVNEMSDLIQGEYFPLSETDLACFDRDDGGIVDAAVKQAAGILREHRKFHRWATDKLLKEESITDGEAWDEFHGIKW